MELILSHHLSFAFCWAFHQPQHVWRNIFFQKCIRPQTCSFLTRGRMPKLTWRFFIIFCIGTGFPHLLSEGLSPLLPDVLEDFSTSSSGLAFEFGAGEDDRPFRPWPPYKSLCNSSSWLKLHESPFEHCPCAFHWKLSSQRRLSFQFDSLWLISFPQLRSGTLKFRVLIIWSVWSFTDVFNRKQLVWPLFRTVSWSYESGDGLRLKQSLVNLDWYNPCRIASESISLADNRAWSHRMSKSWTSSFCKRKLNKSESPSTAS